MWERDPDVRRGEERYDQGVWLGADELSIKVKFPLNQIDGNFEIKVFINLEARVLGYIVKKVRGRWLLGRILGEKVQGSKETRAWKQIGDCGLPFSEDHGARKYGWKWLSSNYLICSFEPGKLTELAFVRAS